MIHENSLCNVDDVLWTDITYGNNIIEKNAENCTLMCTLAIQKIKIFAKL